MKYVENINKRNLECSWGPVGKWRKAHGDNKSGSKGTFRTQTMKTWGPSPTYRVRVLWGGSVVLGPFHMPNEGEPRAADVLRELKSHLKLWPGRNVISRLEKAK